MKVRGGIIKGEMTKQERVALATAILTHGELAVIEFLHKSLANGSLKGQYGGEAWFANQAALKDKYERKVRRDRQPWVTEHNHDVAEQDAQLPARWWQENR